MPQPQYLNPTSMSQPSGYTQVVQVDKTIYIAGQVSATADGQIVGKGDPEAQVRQVWSNIQAAVQAVGGTLHHIVKTTTYITSINYAVAVRQVREAMFQGANPPTSTLLVVSALAHPDYMVEIEAIAVVD